MEKLFVVGRIWGVHQVFVDHVTDSDRLSKGSALLANGLLDKWEVLIIGHDLINKMAEDIVTTVDCCESLTFF